MSQWIEGHVVGKHHWTDELYSLRIDAAVEPFQAGQFTRLALDIDGERVGRPYSYVNGPDERPLEFYFITIPHGPLTDRLRQLQIGDPIWVSARAGGFFTLAAVPDARNLWLFASGTALGVFLSHLKTEEPWRRFNKVILAHGVRTAGELTYQDEIARFARDHGDQFVYIPFVSREETDFALHGRIPDAIRDGRLARRAGIPLTATTCQVMICGNPDMVRDTTAVLEERGLKKTAERNLDRSPLKTTGRSPRMKTPQADAYIGIEQDNFGGMTPAGIIIRDAWVFGLLPEQETCAGWSPAQMQQLYDRVHQAWDPYGHLVSRLPPDLAKRHEHIHGAAIARARALDWAPLLEDD